MSDEIKETGDTFTLGEMRRAYIKYCQGEPLTEKEAVLAEAVAAVVRINS